MPVIFARAHDDRDYVLAASQIENNLAAKAPAAAHLVGVGDSCGKPVPMLRKKVWMAIGDMSLALTAELYLRT